jgi:hypothetical protein
MFARPSIFLPGILIYVKMREASASAIAMESAYQLHILSRHTKSSFQALFTRM